MLEMLGVMAMALTTALIVLLSIGAIVLTAIKMILRGGAKGAAQEIEETRMIQDIYHGLRKMEQRVEALETIFLEGQQKDAK